MTPACRRAVGLLTLAALAFAACARVRPLSGGPPDETPPQLLASSPPDSSSFIPRTPELRLHFDEKISTTSLRRGLRTYPHLRVADVHLSGTSAVVTFADTLPADTTWAVVLGRSVQDLPKRDNRLAREEWLLFTTGRVLESAGVFGRVAVHGKAESKAAVLYQPLAADTTAADTTSSDSLRVGVPRRSRAPGPRYPATATDDEGLYRLFGIPPGRPFQLVAFVDGNGNLTPDAAELQATTPDTLQLARGEILRGLQFDLVDPNEPARIEGVVLNTTAVNAAVAVGLYSVADTSAASTGPASEGDAMAADTSRSVPDAASRAAAAPDSVRMDSTRLAPGAARADTLRSPLPVAPRAESPWAAAYESLEPEGFVPARWTIVYASPRGDYSVRVPPGQHRLIAFVDASADSAPGVYVSADSTRLDWEPLWVGGLLDVGPGETRRPRAIEIKPSP